MCDKNQIVHPRIIDEADLMYDDGLEFWANLDYSGESYEMQARIYAAKYLLLKRNFCGARRLEQSYRFDKN